MGDWRDELWTYDPEIERRYQEVLAGVAARAKAANPPKRGLLDYVTDPAISLAKGVVNAGDTAVGLLDIPTKGRVGKWMEDHLGYNPELTNEFFGKGYSEAQKRANAEVAEAEGFWETTKAMAENPSTIGNAIAESAPSMIGGAGIGRGILLKGGALLPKGASYLAPAAGEGLMMAGQQAENLRRQNDDRLLDNRDIAAAGVTGLAGAAISAGGGAVARKFGFDDIDTMLANAGKKEGRAGLIRSMAGGGITEGGLEEMPQSAIEQMVENYATDKDIFDKVGEASAQGLMTGTPMGVAGNAFGHRTVDDVIDEHIKQPEHPSSHAQGMTVQEGIDQVVKTYQSMEDIGALDSFHQSVLDHLGGNKEIEQRIEAGYQQHRAALKENDPLYDDWQLQKEAARKFNERKYLHVDLNAKKNAEMDRALAEYSPEVPNRSVHTTNQQEQQHLEQNLPREKTPLPEGATEENVGEKPVDPASLEGVNIKTLQGNVQIMGEVKSRQAHIENFIEKGYWPEIVDGQHVLTNGKSTISEGKISVSGYTYAQAVLEHSIQTKERELEELKKRSQPTRNIQPESPVESQKAPQEIKAPEESNTGHSVAKGREDIKAQEQAPRLTHNTPMIEAETPQAKDKTLQAEAEIPQREDDNQELSPESKYFARTPKSTTVPLEQIAPRMAEKEVDPAKMARAGEKMDAASVGKGEKRGPISVLERGDGSYQVLDGNTTYHQLRQRGETSAEVEVKKTLKQRDVPSTDSLYEQAKAAEPAFHEKVQAWSQELGGEARLVPMKSRKRVEEKIGVSDDPIDTVKDVVRGTILFDTAEQVQEGLKKLQKKHEVFRIKNRMNKPGRDGYRDVLLNVRMPNGHIAEIQLNTRAMVEAKESLGHQIYEETRRLRPLARKNPEGREARALAEMESLSKRLYDEAAARSSSHSAANSSASLREMTEQFRNTRNAASSPTSTHLDSSTPSIRQSVNALGSWTKGTSPSYSKNSSDMAVSPKVSVEQQDTTIPQGKKATKAPRRVKSELGQALGSENIVTMMERKGKGGHKGGLVILSSQEEAEAKVAEIEGTPSRDLGQSPRGVKFSRENAIPWPDDFPKTELHTTLARLKSHPDYAAAKAGDAEAARRAILSVVKPEKVKTLKEKHPDAIVVAPHAEEQSGRNALPRMLAEVFGDAGFTVNTEIVQANKPSRTQKGHGLRLAMRPEFNGEIEAGREYILLDDALGQGGTLSELRFFIESNGGKVVATSSLAAGRFGATLAVQPSTLQQLKEKFGNETLAKFLDDFNVAGRPESLTENEGKYLLKQPSLNSLRDRIFASARKNGIDLRAWKVRSSLQVKYSTDGKIQGFTDGTTTYLVEDGIAEGRAWDVLLHEMGSHIHKLLLSDQGFQQVLERIQARQNEDGPTGAAIRSAMERAGQDQGTPHYWEEVASYMVEDTPDVRLVRRIIARIKAILHDVFGPRIASSFEMNEKDLRALAQIAVKREAKSAAKSVAHKRGKDATPGGFLLSMAKTLGVSKAQLGREYDAVVSRYKGTDEWLKAPNGKDSNLNERQWVLVRTPRFKAWFGNWEVSAEEFENAAKYIDDALAGKQMKNLVIGKVDAGLAHEIEKATGVNLDGANIELTANDLRHIINRHGNDSGKQEAITVSHLKAIPYIFSDYDSVRKGTEKDGRKSVILTKKINGVANIVEVIPGKRNSLAVKTMWVKSPGDRLHAKSKNSDPLNTSETAVAHGLYENINDFLVRSKPSKVIDENGEPLVVNGMFVNSDKPAPKEPIGYKTGRELRKLIEEQFPDTDMDDWRELSAASFEVDGNGTDFSKWFMADTSDARSNAEWTFFRSGLLGLNRPKLAVGRRRGQAPYNGRSKNYASGEYEEGVSVINLLNDENQFDTAMYDISLQNKKDRYYLGYVPDAETIYGSDGEPLLLIPQFLGETKDAGTIVKSATGNTGEFSPKNSDIRYSRSKPENIFDKPLSEIDPALASLIEEIAGKMEAAKVKAAKRKERKSGKSGEEVLGSVLTSSGNISKAKVTGKFEGYERLVTALQNDAVDVNEKQRLISDYIKKFPKEVRGLYGLSTVAHRIGAVKSEQKRLEIIRDTMARIDRAHESFEKKRALRQFEKILDKGKAKEIDKIYKGKYGVEYNDEVQSIYEVFSMSAEEVDERQKALLDSAISRELEPNEIMELRRLEIYGDLKNRSSVDVKWALKNLEDTRNDLLSKWREELFADKERRRQERANAVDEITGGRGFKGAEQRNRDKKEEQKFFRRIINGLRDADSLLQSFEFLLDKLAKDAKSGTLESWIVKKFGGMAHDATVAEESGIAEQMARFIAAQQEIYGFTNANALKKKAIENSVIEDDTQVIRRVRRPITNEKGEIQFDENGEVMMGEEEKTPMILSQNQAAKIWMEWQDPSLREQLDSQGITVNTIEEIEKFLSPEMKRWAQWQLDFYQEYYGGVNEVFRKLFYTDMPQNAHYSPIKRLVNPGKEDSNLLRKESMHSSTIPGGLKNRQQNTREILLQDCDQALIRHVAEMEHFKAWAGPMREFRSVLGSDSVNRAISEYHGKETLKVLTQFLDHFSAGRTDAPRSQFMATVRGNFTVAALALNIIVFLKQLTSIPAYAVEMPMGTWAKYLPKTPMEFIKRRKFLLEHSSHLRGRYNMGFDRDMMIAMGKDTATALSGSRRIGDKLMFFTRWGDQFAIIQGGWPVYQYHYEQGLREGLSEENARERAIREFEMATDRSQQAGGLKDLSAIQRGNDFERLFTMFITSPMQYYRHTGAAVRELLRKDGSKARAAKRLFIFNVVLPCVFQAVAGGGENEPEDYIKTMLLGPMSGLPIIRDFGAYLANKITGEPTYGSPGIPHPNLPRSAGQPDSGKR